MSYDGWMGSDGVAGLWALVVVLAIVIGVGLVLGLGIIWLVRHTVGPAPSGQDQALTILRERFARGEITEAEFLEARKVLGA